MMIDNKLSEYEQRARMGMPPGQVSIIYLAAQCHRGATFCSGLAALLLGPHVGLLLTYQPAPACPGSAALVSTAWSAA